MQRAGRMKRGGDNETGRGWWNMAGSMKRGRVDETGQGRWNGAWWMKRGGDDEMPQGRMKHKGGRADESQNLSSFLFLLRTISMWFVQNAPRNNVICDEPYPVATGTSYVQLTLKSSRDFLHSFSLGREVRGYVRRSRVYSNVGCFQYMQPATDFLVMTNVFHYLHSSNTIRSYDPHFVTIRIFTVIS